MVAVLCAAGVQSQKAKIGLERQEFQGFVEKQPNQPSPSLRQMNISTS